MFWWVQDFRRYGDFKKGCCVVNDQKEWLDIVVNDRTVNNVREIFQEKRQKKRKEVAAASNILKTSCISYSIQQLTASPCAFLMVSSFTY